MKTRTYFIMVMFLLVVSFLFADENIFFNNDELTGTWINPEYRGGYTQEQKWILYHWGYWESYAKVESTTHMYKGTFQIMDKWTDSKGNTFCKTIVRYEGYTDIGYELDRISKDGSTLDYAFSSFDFPLESDLNPENAYYRIYYRQ